MSLILKIGMYIIIWSLSLFEFKSKKLIRDEIHIFFEFKSKKLTIA